MLLEVTHRPGPSPSHENGLGGEVFVGGPNGKSLNGLSSNKLASNKLAANRLAANKLSANKLAGNGVDQSIDIRGLALESLVKAD